MLLKKKEKILVGILLGVILFFLFDQFVLSPQKKESSDKNKYQTANKMILEQKGNDSKILEANSVPLPMIGKRNNKTVKTVLINRNNKIDTEMLLKWRRDPFLGVFTAEILDSIQVKSEPTLVLKAISWRDGVAYVIIGKDVYREGESKNGIHVLNVTGDKVVFTQDGERMTLSLGE